MSIAKSFNIWAFVLLFASLSAYAELIARRGVSDSRFKNVRTAILTVNGEPTTCEVGLISSTIGIVAQTCIVINYELGHWDMDTVYGIYVYEGNGSLEPIKYDNITPRAFTPGDLDSTMYANLAVFQYTNTTDNSYKPYSIYDGYNVADSSYVSRLLNLGSKEWSNTNLLQQVDDPSDLCSKYGSLYKANDGLISCNNATIESVYNSDCRMPYGALYTVEGDEVALLALYTHSVILGNDECKDPRLNYYTHVRHALEYASWYFLQKMDVIENHETKTFSATIKDLVTINTDIPNGLSGITTVGADLYARFNAEGKASSSTSSGNKPTSAQNSDMSEDESISNKETGSESLANSDPDLDSLKDNTKGRNIGIIVGCCVAAVIVGIIIWLRIRVRNNIARRNKAIEPADVDLPVFVEQPQTSVPVTVAVPRVQENNEEIEHPPSYEYIVAQRTSQLNAQPVSSMHKTDEMPDTKEKD